jgi:hypothetical protein
LVRGGNDDNGLHDFAHQADYPLKHRLAAKGQPSLGPTHPFTLSSAKNNAADSIGV